MRHERGGVRGVPPVARGREGSGIGSAGSSSPDRDPGGDRGARARLSRGHHLAAFVSGRTARRVSAPRPGVAAGRPIPGDRKGPPGKDVLLFGGRATCYCDSRLTIYLLARLHITMSEFEWESRRVPKARVGAGYGLFHLRLGPVGEYVSLEFPRESVSWVLDPSRSGRPARSRAASRGSPSDSPRTLP